MILKPYKEPARLQLWRCLIPRLEENAEHLQQYWNLEKGHEGEQRFAQLLETVSDGWLVLYDLLLEYSGSIFQIDALLFSEKKIHLFEVKNFEGDFYIDDSGKWHTNHGKEIKNPILQLTRSESLLRQLLLHEFRLSTTIEARLVFNHPEFTLYNAPRELPLIFPSQISRLTAQLSQPPSRLSSRIRTIAEKLAGSQASESLKNRLPAYDYPTLKKGISCRACNSLLTAAISPRIVQCTQCNAKEPAVLAVKRSIRQFQLLFPEKLLTTNGIFDWCGAMPSKKLIRRVLSENFTPTGNGRSTAYSKPI